MIKNLDDCIYCKRGKMSYGTGVVPDYSIIINIRFIFFNDLDMK